MGDAAGAGQLQREQGQQPGQGRDDGGTGVGGGPDQGGQVQGEQVGDGQQQAGQAGLGAGGERGEVDDRGAGQPGVPPGGRRAGAGRWRGAAQQAAEALLGEDLPDAGAVERGSLGAQPGADLIDRQALAAQLESPAPGRGPWPGRSSARACRAGRTAPASRLGSRAAGWPWRSGCSRPGAGLGNGQVLGEVGAQRLIPPLVRVRGPGEVLLAGGRFRCHAPGLPEPPCDRVLRRDTACCPGISLIVLFSGRRTGHRGRLLSL